MVLFGISLVGFSVGGDLFLEFVEDLFVGVADGEEHFSCVAVSFLELYVRVCGALCVVYLFDLREMQFVDYFLVREVFLEEFPVAVVVPLSLDVGFRDRYFPEA